MGAVWDLNILIEGIECACVVDSGSKVTIISEQFFRKYIEPKFVTLWDTTGWLKLTAANDLSIPYLGYVELDLEVMGRSLPQTGVLVKKDAKNKSSTQCLLGMNVLRQLEAFCQFMGKVDMGKQKGSHARLAGQDSVMLPAHSVCRVNVTGAMFNGPVLALYW